MAEPVVPARTYAYRLTRADAIAYQVATQQLTGRMKLALVAWIGSGGLVVGLLRDRLGPTAWLVAAVVVLVLWAVAALVWLNVALRKRADAMQLPDGDIRLDELDDGLLERGVDGERRLAYDRITRVMQAGTHVFVQDGSRPLIVPAAAFADAAEREDFAARLDDARRRARSQ